MLNEFGKCCICGEEVGLPYDREDDSLCNQCFDDLNRWFEYGEILRAGLPEGMSVHDQEWQKEIDERIDSEEVRLLRRFSPRNDNEQKDDNCADVAARLPKQPLIGSGYAKIKQQDLAPVREFNPVVE